MRSMRWVVFAGLVLVALVSAGAQREPGKGPQVTHAEVPYCELARRARVHGRVLIRVTINKEGQVTGTTVERSVPIAVRCAEAAAKRWTFVSSDRDDARQALLSFLFIGQPVDTEEPSHPIASFDDPWSVRLAYARSTIRRLPRESGEIPEKRCPVHGTVMAVEAVPVRYGLWITAEASKERRVDVEREAYGQAVRTLFPETNRSARGGCVVEEPKAEVYYCQACRDAERAWLASHPGFDPHR